MPNQRDLTILHIEDDPMMALIVQRALEGIGFDGKLLSAKSIHESMELLRQKALEKQHLSLILSDMQLPDGTGLEILHEVKNDAHWHLTPVIILSNESDPNWVDAAYDAGAACYFPKENVVKTLESLYFCWLERASWPQPSTVDRLQAAVARGTYIRGQVSEFYLGGPSCHP